MKARAGAGGTGSREHHTSTTHDHKRTTDEMLSRTPMPSTQLPDEAGRAQGQEIECKARDRTTGQLDLSQVC
jgi:hypothetical protein